jgi:hypothetical protein
MSDAIAYTSDSAVRGCVWKHAYIRACMGACLVTRLSRGILSSQYAQQHPDEGDDDALDAYVEVKTTVYDGNAPAFPISCAELSYAM